jgi:hypothetical protein
VAIKDPARPQVSAAAVDSANDQPLSNGEAAISAAQTTPLQSLYLFILFEDQNSGMKNQANSLS